MGLFENKGHGSIQVGAAGGNQGEVRINGEVWANSPQVAGYPQATGRAGVITAQVGRIQAILAVGGIYPNQTEGES